MNRLNDEQWKFAQQEGLFDPDRTQVEQAEFWPEGNQTGLTPFVYYPGENRVMLGPEGALHWELLEHEKGGRVSPEEWEDRSDRAHGYIEQYNPEDRPEINWYDEHPHMPMVNKALQERYPNATIAQPNSWKFGSDEGDILNWDEGQEGKGIIDRNGHVYTWDNEDYEVHSDFLKEHPDIVPMRYFWIEPDGRAYGSGLGDELDNQDEEVLREADPRLYVNRDLDNTWNFALQ